MTCDFQPLLRLLEVLASAAVPVAAFMALNTWKKQLRGTDRYTAAVNTLVSLYKVRDDIAIVRNPWQPAGAPDVRRERENYNRRLERIRESRQGLYESAVLGQAVFGSEARDALNKVSQIIKELEIMADTYFCKRHSNTILESAAAM